MVISDHMSTVDDHHQRQHSCASSVHCHFFQLVERTLDIQERSGVPWTSNAEQAANVAENLLVRF